MRKISDRHHGHQGETVNRDVVAACRVQNEEKRGRDQDHSQCDNDYTKPDAVLKSI